MCFWKLRLLTREMPVRRFIWARSVMWYHHPNDRGYQWSSYSSWEQSSAPMENDYPEKFGVLEHYRYLCQSFARAYFFSRQRLIEVLISEGLARTMINELAFEYDSYCSRADGMLPKKESLLNLFLFTERYQELYDLCCFYARIGDK